MPDTLIVSGELFVLLWIVISAESAPTTEGINRNVSVNDCPGPIFMIVGLCSKC